MLKKIKQKKNESAEKKRAQIEIKNALAGIPIINPAKIESDIVDDHINEEIKKEHWYEDFIFDLCNKTDILHSYQYEQCMIEQNVKDLFSKIDAIPQKNKWYEKQKEAFQWLEVEEQRIEALNRIYKCLENNKCAVTTMNDLIKVWGEKEAHKLLGEFDIPDDISEEYAGFLYYILLCIFIDTHSFCKFFDFYRKSHFFSKKSFLSLEDKVFFLNRALNNYKYPENEEEWKRNNNILGTYTCDLCMDYMQFWDSAKMGTEPFLKKANIYYLIINKLKDKWKENIEHWI